MKRRFVSALERACGLTHFVTLHRPWLWVFPHCPFAKLSASLDERWDTGAWVKS